MTQHHIISMAPINSRESAMFNRPFYLDGCGSKGHEGTCHDAFFDHYCLSLLYNPAQRDYMIWSVDASSGLLHQKMITLSTDFPPYKRLLCWQFRKSIETFCGLYKYKSLPQLEATIDYSKADSTLGAGESTFRLFQRRMRKSARY
jgi:hypothetical protein